MSGPDYGEPADLAEARAAMRARLKPGRASINPLRRKRDAVELHEAYVRLFFDEGQLRPSARLVLDDLAEAAAVGMAAGEVGHAELCILEGKRRLWLHLLGRFQMNQERIDEFNRQMKKGRLDD